MTSSLFLSGISRIGLRSSQNLQKDKNPRLFSTFHFKGFSLNHWSFNVHMKSWIRNIQIIKNKRTHKILLKQWSYSKSLEWSKCSVVRAVHHLAICTLNSIQERNWKRSEKNNEILHNGFIAPDWFNVLAIIYDVVKTVSQIIYNSRMTHYINTKSRLN